MNRKCSPYIFTNFHHSSFTFLYTYLRFYRMKRSISSQLKRLSTIQPYPIPEDWLYYRGRGWGPSCKMIVDKWTNLFNYLVIYVKSVSECWIGKEVDCRVNPTIIAPQLALARILNQPRCQSTENWLKKLWYTHYGMAFSSKINHEVLSIATKCVSYYV